MYSCNNKIIVRADVNGKETFLLNGVEVSSALLFEKNYREKSPVLCQSESENDVIIKGDILLCHHNTFYQPSPYYLHDDLYSIPANGEIIFCKLNIEDGSLFPVYGNMICERKEIETAIPVPVSKKAYYPDRAVVVEPGYCNFKRGQLLFIRPFGWYEIVYNWQKQLKRVIKVHQKQVCGVFVNN